MFKKYNIKYYNFILIFLVVALMVTGVLVINKVDDSFTTKQVVGIIISIVIMIVLSFVDYHFIIK